MPSIRLSFKILIIIVALLPIILTAHSGPAAGEGSSLWDSLSTDTPAAYTLLSSEQPKDLGYPQPGDLLFKLSCTMFPPQFINKFPFITCTKGWRPGHVGIYVGERQKDGETYNVIEALNDGVARRLYVDLNSFGPGGLYMGAREPRSMSLTNEQRQVVVNQVEAAAEAGIGYAWDKLWSTPVPILEGWRGDGVKGGGDSGSVNCVGLAEMAYEQAGVNNGVGLVTDFEEGNAQLLSFLTPAEQYMKTRPAAGYAISGRVVDGEGKGIGGVRVVFMLKHNNDYQFDVLSNDDGYWQIDRLGREWDVKAEKDGLVFTPAIHQVYWRFPPESSIVLPPPQYIEFQAVTPVDGDN
jgi:hypothetical protein